MARGRARSTAVAPTPSAPTSRSRAQPRGSTSSAHRRFAVMLAVALGLSSSLCWGLADFLGGLQARRLTTLFVVAVSQAVGLLAVAGAVALAAGSPPRLVQLGPAALAGVAGALGLGAFYRGLAIGTMSIVAPIASTGVVLPVVVGVMRGER